MTSGALFLYFLNKCIDGMFILLIGACLELLLGRLKLMLSVTLVKL